MLEKKYHRNQCRFIHWALGEGAQGPGRIQSGCGSRVVKVSDRGWPCHEFEPSTTKVPPCRGAMYVKSVESSNVLLLVWCGSWERAVLAQVSSTSLDHGSKLRGPSPKALV
ncbi:hypothetical protein TNCV_744451 [Trichonephila clavipes]|nr:hypothetical protein TNCV_744451 [Trichonephila clavipes]